MDELSVSRDSQGASALDALVNGQTQPVSWRMVFAWPLAKIPGLAHECMP